MADPLAALGDGGGGGHEQVSGGGISGAILAGKSCAITPIIARRTDVRKTAGPGPFSDLRQAQKPSPRRRVRALPTAQREHPVLLRDHDYSRGGSSDEWIAI